MHSIALFSSGGTLDFAKTVPSHSLQIGLKSATDQFETQTPTLHQGLSALGTNKTKRVWMETCALNKFYNEVLGPYSDQHYTLVFYSILRSRKANSYQNTCQNIQNPLCGVNQPHCPADAFQTRRSIELTTIKMSSERLEWVDEWIPLTLL